MDYDVDFIGEVRIASAIGLVDDGNKKELGCGSIDWWPFGLILIL